LHSIGICLKVSGPVSSANHWIGLSSHVAHPHKGRHLDQRLGQGQLALPQPAHQKQRS